MRACSGILAAKGIVEGAAMRIGFIGFGNMASAMADGWIAAGVDAGRMSACAGHFDALRERCEARGMTACSGAAEVVAASDLLIVAVKPHLIAEVVGPLADELSGKAVLSVAWGWDCAKWEELLPGAAHLSCVPNTPVSVNEGVIAVERASTMGAEIRAEVLDLLGKLGLVVELESRLLFVGGTVGGCSPAFVAMGIEALADAAVKHGIPRADAYRIVSQMMLGTAKLQLETGEHPATMKDAVCYQAAPPSAAWPSWRPPACAPPSSAPSTPRSRGASTALFDCPALGTTASLPRCGPRLRLRQTRSAHFSLRVPEGRLGPPEAYRLQLATEDGESWSRRSSRRPRPRAGWRGPCRGRWGSSSLRECSCALPFWACGPSLVVEKTMGL